ncbi:hypothetical protein M5K25_013548 [Dendrobium thyrsiflorum]|uniref:Uncharacterized protein n=1 Tax=Dendrobium thyrsiflorum TaxID=117978 RepID=A0ABD0UTX7_DENTH
MGSCFSSSSFVKAIANPPLTAKVIDFDGALIEYSETVKATHVLGRNLNSFFLCNAENLFYDHLIKALESNHLVELGKLYFVLPAKKLNFPLTAVDMAALAVRASAAFTAAAYVEVLPFMGVVDVQSCKRFNEVRVGGWKSGWSVFSNGEMKQSSSRTRLSAIEEEVE